MTTEKEAMKAVADRQENPAFVLLMVGEVWEVETRFEKAYEKYSEDEDMEMAITELKGVTQQ